MGADDYVSKPFRLRELLSRIKSVLRRYKAESGAPSVISLGNVTVHTGQGKVYKNGEEILLTAMEYRLLLILASRPGQIMTRGKLLEDMWDIAGDYVNDNTLTVYIKRLREKIEDDPKNPTVIKTVRGIGYMTENNINKSVAMLRNREIKIFCLIVILLLQGYDCVSFLYPDAAWLLLVLSFLIIFAFYCLLSVDTGKYGGCPLFKTNRQRDFQLTCGTIRKASLAY